LIILTADHGEYMGENMRTDRFFSHGGTPFEAETRVPLLVKFPDGSFRGKRIETPTSLVDVFPSIMEIIGEHVTVSEGTSFLEQIDGSDPRPDATSFIQVGSGRTLAVRRGKYKLIVRSPDDIDELTAKLRAGEDTALDIKLFDVVSDPLERKDISATHPEIRESLYTAIVTWLITPASGPDYSTIDRIDAETAAHLRALGYIEEAGSVTH
jgi:arylsulfatase A-like enzyme